MDGEEKQQPDRGGKKKPANRALKSGQVWVRTRQAMAEEDGEGNIARVEKGGYLRVPTERAKALGELAEAIEGEPPEDWVPDVTLIPK